MGSQRVLSFTNFAHAPQAAAVAMNAAASAAHFSGWLNWCHPPIADCYLEARNLQGDYWCGEKRFSKGLKY
jgi:hypothetical protein